MKALKALLALFLLTLLLGGVPALLLAWGNPLALLDVDWAAAFLRPDDGTILLGALSVVGWLAWIALTVTTIVEVVSHLSRRRIRLHLPGIRWLQPAVGALVAMALTPVLSSNADEPVPPPASHAPQQVRELNVTAASRPSMQSSSPSQRDYVVQAGDELWGLAERELGSGADWRIILSLNAGMTAETTLTPGDTIRLPLPTQAMGHVESTAPTPVIVERGDTLWDLAEEHLGDAYRWPELFAANRDVVTDPDQIDIGWQLSMPQKDVLPAALDARDTTEPSTSTPDASRSQPPSQPHQQGSAQANPVQQDGLPQPTVSQGSVPQSADPDADMTPATAAAVVTDSTDPPTNSVASPSMSPRPSPVAPIPATDTDPHPPDGSVVLQSDHESLLELLGPVGVALAASLVAGVLARRRVQLLHRGIGRRITTLAPSLQRFFAALVHQSHTAPVDPIELPATSVVLGWDDSGDKHADLEVARCTLISGSDDHTAGMTSAILTSLLCAEWSTSVEVVAVQPHVEWSTVLEDPRLSSEDDLEAALTHLQRLCAQRRLQLGHADLAEVRADPDRADVWAPVVFLFCRALHPAHLDRIRDHLSLGQVGVSIVAAAQSHVVTDSAAIVLTIESGIRARLGGGTAFQPQFLDQPARHAVMSLFASASDDRTEPAPWWRDGEDVAVTVPPNLAAGPIKDGAMPAWSTQPDHPTLLVLGPVELLGSRGERPTRATGQCMEYCAWLLLNPGSSPTAMVRELLVAETTRRSNMSRLRTWLGNDTSNNPYLPDAYSGRITLAPAVTSDWERFQSLMAGGVNNSSTPLLREALSLVRGQPLDGVAFQWPWTSQWMSDMVSMISDAATVLADRCLTEEDHQGALWAVNQGQLATGDDETLAVRRIQVMAQTGERAEVDAAVMQLTRAARATNRDLSPDSIRRVQQALHLSMSKVSGS